MSSWRASCGLRSFVEGADPPSSASHPLDSGAGSKGNSTFREPSSSDALHATTKAARKIVVLGMAPMAPFGTRIFDEAEWLRSQALLDLKQLVGHVKPVSGNTVDSPRSWRHTPTAQSTSTATMTNVRILSGPLSLPLIKFRQKHFLKHRNSIGPTRSVSANPQQSNPPIRRCAAAQSSAIPNT